jgi:hypothetical protein
MTRRRKRKRRGSTPGVPRRSVLVRFYRAYIGDEIATPSDLDRARAYDNINKLAWDRASEDGRYHRSADGETFSAWPYLVGGKLRLTVGRDLADANPAYEQKGRLDFAKIDPGSKWVGLTYCVLFDNAVVGVINSQQGPNTLQLAAYLQNKGQTAAPLSFQQLSRTDIIAQLRRLQYVSRYEIAVEPGSLFFPKLDGPDANDIERVMSAAASLRDARIVRVTVESESKRTPLSGFLDFAKSMVSSGSVDTAWAREFEISGPDIATGNLHPINLLRDYLCATKIVPLQNKALDEEAAFRAIESAYAENLHEFPTFKIRPLGHNE